MQDRAVSFDHHAGWTSVPLLSRAEAQAIVADCQRLTQLPPNELDPRDKPTAGTRHLRKLDVRLPMVGQLLERPALLDMVHEIVGDGAVLQQAEYRCPQPGFGAQRLHTDWLAKTDDGPAHVATAIVALVDFTANNGATRVVPGSHQRPDLQRHAGQLENHADERVLTGAAGTAFIFSGHLLHASGQNNSTTERHALQLVWHRAQ